MPAIIATPTERCKRDVPRIIVELLGFVARGYLAPVVVSVVFRVVEVAADGATVVLVVTVLSDVTEDVLARARWWWTAATRTCRWRARGTRTASVASVVVLVVATAGGAAVVVTSDVEVLLAGVAQPANATVPAIIATPSARRKPDFISIILEFLRVQAVQRTTVVSLDFLVEVVSPIGDTVVPLELDLVDSVTTPLMSDDFWVLVDIDWSDGIGATGIVVVWVVIELEDEPCAKAAPVISVTATVAAARILIMSDSPGRLGTSGIARLPSGNVALATGWRQGRKLLMPAVGITDTPTGIRHARARPHGR
jgi:hypothetical protein